MTENSFKQNDLVFLATGVKKIKPSKTKFDFIMEKINATSSCVIVKTLVATLQATC